MVHLTIDGQPCACPPGTTVLLASRSIGRIIPTLCHDDRLSPSGACRLCLVSLEGQTRPVAACTTPVSEGMSVETSTDELERVRRELLELLAQEYPGAALSMTPEKEFHHLLLKYGLGENDCSGGRGDSRPDDSHPYIHVDMTRCIYCYRCVRICDEVQGQSVWRIWNRGDETRIRPDGPSLLASSCVGCGACVDTCPTGALEDKTRIERGPAETWTRTVCSYCGVGCELTVGARQNGIVAIRPVLDAPVNRGHLCVKGRYTFDFVSSDDRITEPLRRTPSGWTPISWDEATALTARGLTDLIERHGPDAVAILGSARATNEENYLLQKFARTVVGTNNVDCCARVCHAPTAAALKHMFGTGASTNSFDDIDEARGILLCGANATENHPIVGARIKQAVRGGARLIVIDPRRIELVAYADLHLALRPGTNVPLLNALAHTIVAERLHDEAYVRERVDGWEEFRVFIGAWTPERAATICGVDAGQIRHAARLYAAERPAMTIHGLGLTEHTQGTDGVCCLANLALLTGNLGRDGGGVNALRGQNNVQGAAHMGCDPATLTGGIPLGAGRETFAAAWNGPLPTATGLQVLEMMSAAAAGRLKGLWAVGYDVLLTDPNANETRRALGNIETLIGQDMFLTETIRAFGTIFLPVASTFEKDGTFMNAERRVQRVRRTVDPPGAARPDWQIVCDVAKAMGKGSSFDFRSPEDIWNEIRSVWPAAEGITYARLDERGLQWPCPSIDHPGTPVLHGGAFPIGKRASLQPIDYVPTSETVSEQYPLLLTTGRTLHQFNAGTMTRRTPSAELRPEDLLDVSPVDAHRLMLRDGSRARVSSRYGTATLRVHVTAAVPPGTLFATFHTAEVFLNRVTSPRLDRAGTPEYKLTAVRVEGESN